MTDILPPWPLLTAFLVASLVLAVTPGPGVVYILTRSVSQGPRSGLASMAGVALGNFANAAGAAIGLAALLAVSSAAFLIVKYAGALYLIYLGVKALRLPAAGTATRFAATVCMFPVFRDGFMVALFNPKTALFFAAFLPQFMSPQAEPVLQSIALGGLFVLIAAVTDTAYVAAAGTVAMSVAGTARFRRLGRFAVGGTFIGLGLIAAVGGPRSGK
jgi:threonine/homoserine/homoserine lactone efflux protein